MTEFIKINTNQPEKEILEKAAGRLHAGELVSFPTETVYGLGAIATDAHAAEKIYRAKGRPSDNPLIIHIAEPEDAERYAFVSPLYKKLAKAFMPGPLTVILPKRDNIPMSVTGGLDTVAVRCPSHPVARELIRTTGGALAAPSATLSGSPSPTCAMHVRKDLEGRVDMILDGGICEIGLESTIVKLDGEKITLLRPGAVTYDALCCVAPYVEIAEAVTHALSEDEKPLSPGMKYRHYAPSAPLVLLDGDEDCVLHYMRHMQNVERCAIICYEEDLPYLRYEHVISIGRRDDLVAQANALFSALRKTDEMEVDAVFAPLPPKEGLGLALYNRMIRAAAHTVQKV